VLLSLDMIGASLRLHQPEVLIGSMRVSP